MDGPTEVRIFCCPRDQERNEFDLNIKSKKWNPGHEAVQPTGVSPHDPFVIDERLSGPLGKLRESGKTKLHITPMRTVVLEYSATFTPAKCLSFVGRYSIHGAYG